MQMKASLLLATLTFGFSVQNQAQVLNENRIEFDLNEDYEDFGLSAYGADGLILYAKLEKKDIWKLERYSTDLKSDKSVNVTIGKKQTLKKKVEDENELNMLFTDAKGNYTFIHVEPATLEVTKKSGVMPKKTQVGEIAILNNLVLVAGQNTKGPVLFTIDYQSGKQTFIPLAISGYGPKDLTIENMQIMEDETEAIIYINAADSRLGKNVYDQSVYAMHINTSSKKTDLYMIETDGEHQLTSVSASKTGDDEYILTGTYSTRGTNTSQGIFIAGVSNKTVSFIKYHNFLDFNEFLSYLPDRKKEKIEKKKERKEDNDKEFSIDYLMASHEIAVMNDQYIYLGEAYYPTYRTETYTTTVNGQTVTRTRTVFDGNQYTHATIAAFDDEGELIWDRTFEMWPSYKPFFAKRFIELNIDEDNINMLFASNNSIKSMQVDDNGKILHDNSAELIDTGSDSDKVKDSYSNLSYWYDNYFLAHGNQTIKDSDASFGKKKRRVYFINKISFE